MLLSEVVKNLNLTPRVEGVEDREVTGAYCSDLLSDVLAKAKNGQVWITNQKHQNCVAVASLLGLSALIVAGGFAPDENTLEKANSEMIPLYTTDLPAFEVCGRMYAMGIRG